MARFWHQSSAAGAGRPRRAGTGGDAGASSPSAGPRPASGEKRDATAASSGAGPLGAGAGAAGAPAVPIVGDAAALPLPPPTPAELASAGSDPDLLSLAGLALEGSRTPAGGDNAPGSARSGRGEADPRQSTPPVPTSPLQSGAGPSRGSSSFPLLPPKEGEVRPSPRRGKLSLHVGGHAPLRSAAANHNLRSPYAGASALRRRLRTLERRHQEAVARERRRQRERATLREGEGASLLLEQLLSGMQEEEDAAAARPGASTHPLTALRRRQRQRAESFARARDALRSRHGGGGSVLHRLAHAAHRGRQWREEQHPQVESLRPGPVVARRRRAVSASFDRMRRGAGAEGGGSSVGSSDSNDGEGGEEEDEWPGASHGASRERRSSQGGGTLSPQDWANTLRLLSEAGHVSRAAPGWSARSDPSVGGRPPVPVGGPSLAWGRPQGGLWPTAAAPAATGAWSTPWPAPAQQSSWGAWTSSPWPAAAAAAPAASLSFGARTAPTQWGSWGGGGAGAASLSPPASTALFPAPQPVWGDGSGQAKWGPNAWWGSALAASRPLGSHPVPVASAWQAPPPPATWGVGAASAAPTGWGRPSFARLHSRSHLYPHPQPRQDVQGGSRYTPGSWGGGGGGGTAAYHRSSTSGLSSAPGAWAPPAGRAPSLRTVAHAAADAAISGQAGRAPWRQYAAAAAPSTSWFRPRYFAATQASSGSAPSSVRGPHISGARAGPSSEAAAIDTGPPPAAFPGAGRLLPPRVMFAGTSDSWNADLGAPRAGDSPWPDSASPLLTPHSPQSVRRRMGMPQQQRRDPPLTIPPPLVGGGDAPPPSPRGTVLRRS